jgi:hypothetical protein
MEQCPICTAPQISSDGSMDKEVSIKHQQFHESTPVLPKMHQTMYFTRNYLNGKSKKRQQT